MKNLLKKIWHKYTISIIFIIVLSILLPIINNTIPKLSQILLDNGIMSKNSYFIIVTSSALIILYGLKYLFNNLIQSRIISINFNTISNLKKEIVNSIISLPMIFHDKNSSEYLLARINEVDNLSTLFSANLIMFFINIFTAIVSFIFILYKNVILALLSILLIPFFIFMCKTTFTKITAQISTSLESSAKTNEKMYSLLKGTITLKQFNEENTLLKDLNNSIDKLTTTLLVKNSTINKNTNLIGFFIYGVQAFLCCIVALYIVKGSLSVGDYLSLSQYLSLIYAPIISYQGIGISLKPALISFKRLKSLYSSSNSNKKDIVKSIDSINSSHLYFKYNENIPLLNDINFELNKGDKILITGPNGCGKTTLAKLLLGFYDNYSGNILINGKELRSLNEQSLREKVAIVPQKCFLFNTSLIENIQIANNKLPTADFYKKINYLKKLNLFDGMDLNISSIENGKNLSGGQIQRISLARILIRDFDVCIFDEITNSLDVHSKKIIKEIIKNNFNDKICIFISHDDYLYDLVNCKLDLSINLGVGVIPAAVPCTEKHIPYKGNF
ncbi:ATP-binding cassette domain-containing protein [Clostridium sp.]|uniref:ATP-binding cassette domain-containing protein n=1 Tax=Clostridium sp. TaxID=1506 RepID=UPI00359F4D63